MRSTVATLIIVKCQIFSAGPYASEPVAGRVRNYTRWTIVRAELSHEKKEIISSAPCTVPVKCLHFKNGALVF